MHSDDIINLSYVFIILLVPLIPAYFVYKILPSEKKPSGAEVSGPFAGLKIKLTGALGGYFIIAILAFIAIKIVCISDDKKHIKNLQERITFLEQHYFLWEIEGKIELGENAAPFDPAKISIDIKPPLKDIRDDGRLFIKWDSPLSLTVKSDKFLAEVVQLESKPKFGARDYGVTIDTEAKKITIKKPIVLHPVKDYR